MNRIPGLEATADALRLAFDEAFANAPPAPPPQLESLLGIGVAGILYAVPLQEIAGIQAARRIVPVPSVTTALLGLAGIHGVAVPVFELAVLLGHGHQAQPPRWMILCGGQDGMALAFTHFHGCLRIPREHTAADDRHTADQPHVERVVRAVGAVRSVVSIPLIVATIRNRVCRLPPAREQ